MARTARDVLLFVPNLIGYFRIVLTIFFIYFAPTHYYLASACYLFNVGLDELDGISARYLNQCSGFGAIMDLLTDCCFTGLMLSTLTLVYPDYAFVFQISNVFLFAGHMMYLYASLAKENKNQKLATKKNIILKLYFNNQIIFLSTIHCHAWCLTMLYVLRFTEGPVVNYFHIGLWRIILYVTAPLSVFKELTNICQLVEGSLGLANLDAQRLNA